MNKKEAKDLLESYINFLKKRKPEYSQILSNKIKEKGNCCNLGCESKNYDIQLIIRRKWNNNDEKNA